MTYKWVKGRGRALVYYASAWYDLWRRYWEDARGTLLRGGIVLSDRYIYDLRHLNFNRPTPICPVTRWVLCSAFPRPDLVFFLEGEPEVLALRKDQLTPEEVRSLQEIYRRTLRGYPVIKLHAEDDVDSIADRACAEIVARYFGGTTRHQPPRYAPGVGGDPASHGR